MSKYTPLFFELAGICMVAFALSATLSWTELFILVCGLSNICRSMHMRVLGVKK